MKTKFNLHSSLIAIPFLAILFTSCQQDPDDIDILEPADSTYLSMAITLDLSEPAGLDTFSKAIYMYDAKKRLYLAQVNEYQYGLPRPNAIEQWRFYSGNDTLPNMIVRNIPSAGPGNPILRDTVFPTYSNGIVIKDSMTFREIGSGNWGNIITKYTRLNPAKVLIWRLDKRYGDVDSIISHQTIVNGNTTVLRDTMWMSYYAAPGNYVAYEDVMQYDNKPNPFARMRLPYMWARFGTGIGPDARTLIPDVLSVNNETSLNEYENTPWFGEVTYNYTSTYQYRSNGYPIHRIRNEFGMDYKTVYFYTRL